MPLLPTEIAFSRRSTHSRRASSRDHGMGIHRDVMRQLEVTGNVVVLIGIYIYYYYDSGHSGLTNGRVLKKKMPPAVAGGILRA